MSTDAPLSGGAKAGYGLAELGAGILLQSTSVYLMIFYTDVFGISVVAASTLFLIARIWDAINDPLMGAIVDRTKTRWGKFRPYMLFGAIPMAAITAMCFTAVDLSENGKLIYAYVTFIGFGMLYTMVTIPYGALSSSLTMDSKERGSVSGIRMMFGMVGGMVVALIPFMIEGFGGEDKAKGYMITMWILCGVAALCFLVSFATTKERYSAPPQDARFSVKDVVTILKANKPLTILCLAFTANSANMAVATATGTYYFTYNLGMPEKFPLMMLTQLVVIFFGIIASQIALKKFDKKNILIVGTLLGMVKPAAMYFPDLNIILGATVIGGFGQGLAVALIWAFVADTIEYGQYKTGKREEGMTYAVFGFFLKFGGALGAVVPGLVLDYTGYVPNVEQTEFASFGITTLAATIPLCVMSIFVLIFSRYDLDSKKHEKIVAELKQREALA